MNKIDFSCPKCGCENTVKVTPKMFDGTSTGQWMWWGIMIIIGIIIATAFGCSRSVESRRSNSEFVDCKTSTTDSLGIAEMRKELFSLLPQQRKEFYQQFLFRDNATFNENIRKQYEEVETFWNETERLIDWMPLEYKYEFWDMAYDKIASEMTRLKRQHILLGEVFDELAHQKDAGEALSLLESSLKKAVALAKGDQTVVMAPAELETKRAFPRLFASVAAEKESVIPRIVGIATDYAHVAQAQKHPGKRANELEVRVFP